MMLLGPYLAVCALLVAAGVAKVVRPRGTARALALVARAADTVPGPGPGARVPQRLGWWVAAVRVGATAEAALGIAALARPTTGLAAAVATSYGAFAIFVAHARRRSGPLATCGCFGAPDTVPTGIHVAIDLALAAGAAGVAAEHGRAAWPAILVHQPGAGVPLVLAALMLAWLAWALMGPFGQLVGARRALHATSDTAAPEPVAVTLHDPAGAALR